MVQGDIIHKYTEKGIAFKMDLLMETLEDFNSAKEIISQTIDEIQEKLKDQAILNKWLFEQKNAK